MTEAEFEDEVRRLCARLGITRFHVPDSRGMARGLPDEIIIGKKGLLWRELKLAGTEPSSEQRRIAWKLKALGEDYAIWRPADLLSGKIERELKSVA